MKNLHKLFLLATLALAGQACDLGQLNAAKRNRNAQTGEADAKRQRTEDVNNDILEIETLERVNVDQPTTQTSSRPRLPKEIMQLIAEHYFASLDKDADFSQACKSFLQVMIGLSDKKCAHNFFIPNGLDFRRSPTGDDRSLLSRQFNAFKGLGFEHPLFSANRVIGHLPAISVGAVFASLMCNPSQEARRALNILLSKTPKEEFLQILASVESRILLSPMRLDNFLEGLDALEPTEQGLNRFVSRYPFFGVLATIAKTLPITESESIEELLSKMEMGNDFENRIMAETIRSLNLTQKENIVIFKCLKKIVCLFKPQINQIRSAVERFEQRMIAAADQTDQNNG